LSILGESREAGATCLNLLRQMLKDVALNLAGDSKTGVGSSAQADVFRAGTHNRVRDSTELAEVQGGP
jgi:hypothetical protein